MLCSSLPPRHAPLLIVTTVHANVVACAAPELFDPNLGDMWALGCILYTLCFRTRPFPEGAAVGPDAPNGPNSSCDIPAGSPFSEEVHGLIRAMLTPGLAHRASTATILERTRALCARGSRALTRVQHRAQDDMPSEVDVPSSEVDVPSEVGVPGLLAPLPALTITFDDAPSMSLMGQIHTYMHACMHAYMRACMHAYRPDPDLVAGPS